MDPNVGVILSTTLKKYRKTLTDNIHKSNAVFYWLKENGAIKEEDGGERIVEPLMYGKNTTAGSYDGYDTLDTTPQTGIDSAEFQWKQYAVSITISGKEERQNKGTSRIINLLEAKTKQAEMSLTEELTTGLFSNGTGNGSKQLTGLLAMVDDTGTYGGINSANHSWWRATDTAVNGALALANMRSAMTDASSGGKDAPNLIVTDADEYEAYEALVTGTLQTQGPSSKKLGDAGYQTLEYKGVPIVWDELCTAGYMFFLNTRHMKLVVHKDANFDVTDFQQPEAQDAKIAKILFMGNLTCNRRASFARLTGLTD